jgi:DHA2 family multidrug resistance protein
LFNLTRNLGGAVGLAVINTMMNNRLDLHLARLRESISWGHTRAEEVLAALAGQFQARGSDAELAAVKQMAAIVRREALVFAMSDVFTALTLLFFALLLLIPLTRRPKPAPAGAGGGGH